MKLVVSMLVLIASCKSERAPAPTPGSGSAPAAFDACEVGTRTFEHATCSSAEGTKFLDQAHKTLAGTLDIAHKAATADPHQLQIVCARMLHALVRDASTNGCKIDVSEADRKQMQALLDAWYAERTPVAATGSGASDAVIAKIVAIRDAMCACTDVACLTKVDAQIDSIGALPKDAPQAARDLGGKLFDDVARCEAKVRD